MLRMLLYCALLTTIAWSLSEIVSHWGPSKRRAIGWSVLSVALIATGVWMISADLG